MKEYEELIKALRCKSNDINDCTMCAYHNACYGGTLEEIAADALEAAEKRIDGLQKLVDINTERCEALRKQLKESHENYKKHLNELETQIPKEGEWIESNTRPRSAQFYCSVCHRTCYDIQPTRDKAWTKRCRYHYCPNCGAKMKGEQK